MARSIQHKKIIFLAFIKASAACLLLVLLTKIQFLDPVREGIENYAFDLVSSYFLKRESELNKGSQVTILDIDTNYMKKNELYDKNGNPVYGHTFPREHLVEIIQKIDQQVTNRSCPKALFIDFALDDTSDSRNKLSNADVKLLDELKKERCYPILLPRVYANSFFIDNVIKKDTRLYELIKNKKIIFVSPDFYLGKDNIVRRYIVKKQVGDALLYSVSLQLWAIERKAGINQLDSFTSHVSKKYLKNSELYSLYHQTNVNANMIWFKDNRKSLLNATTLEHKKRKLTDDELYKHACDYPVSSYWQGLKRYPAYCNYNDLPSSVFNGSFILLGGTYNAADEAISNDFHQVANYLGDEKRSGLEIHANILMTLLHLDQSMPLLPLKYGLLITFLVFIFLDLLIIYSFRSRGLFYPKVENITLFILAVTFLFYISGWLMGLKNPYWFNWFVPFLLIEIIDWLPVFVRIVVQYVSIIFEFFMRLFGFRRSEVNE